LIATCGCGTSSTGASRRALIEELWAPSAINATLNLEAVSHDEIEARVTRAYDQFVGTDEHRFEADQPPIAHHGAVRVSGRTVTVDGTVVARGQEFLVLDERGRRWRDGSLKLSARARGQRQ
jgi:uncharacterized protein